MATTRDSTLIEVPIVLRDLIAHHRLHARQALHEVVEEAVLYWLECGGWAGLPGPWMPDCDSRTGPLVQPYESAPSGLCAAGGPPLR